MWVVPNTYANSEVRNRPRMRLATKDPVRIMVAWPMRALWIIPVSCAGTAADGGTSPTPIGGTVGGAYWPGCKMGAGGGGTGADGMADRMDGGALGPQDGDSGICCGEAGRGVRKSWEGLAPLRWMIVVISCPMRRCCRLMRSSRSCCRRACRSCGMDWDGWGAS